MRRKYIKSKKSSKLRQQALEQLRETRDKIRSAHPGLLSEMEKRINDAEKAAARSARPATQDNAVMDDIIAIDRRKNMQTVMTFLQDGSRSPEFVSKLHRMLAENQTRH